MRGTAGTRGVPVGHVDLEEFIPPLPPLRQIRQVVNVAPARLHADPGRRSIALVRRPWRWRSGLGADGVPQDPGPSEDHRHVAAQPVAAIRPHMTPPRRSAYPTQTPACTEAPPRSPKPKYRSRLQGRAASNATHAAVTDPEARRHKTPLGTGGTPGL